MISWASGRSGRWRVVALGAVAMLLAVACGSTVQHSETAASGGQRGFLNEDEGLSLASPPDEGDLASSTRSPQERAGSTGSAVSERAASTGSAVPGGPGSVAPGSTSTRQNGATPRRGRGFTENEVFVGLSMFTAVNQVYKAIGSRAPQGDQENAWRALVDDLNKRGGLAGRKVVPVFFDLAAEDAFNPNAGAQKACTRWTEDRPVFAAISLAGPINNGVLYKCMANKQTPFVIADDRLRSSAQMARYAQSGFFYGPPMPSIERLVPVWVQRAKASGFFSKWDTLNGGPGVADVKVGILDTRLDEYGAGRFTQVMKRELARHGIEVGSTFMFSGEASSRDREVNQAVLQFSRAEVTHVFPSWGMIPFTQHAESQNYRPRYTVNTSNWPQQQLQLSPRRQLNGAVGVGYRPTQDVDNARDPGEVSKAASRCRKIMREAGEPTSDRDAMVFNTFACDGIWFFENAVEKGGDELSTVGLRRGLFAIGSMPSANTFRMSFPQGRPEGASAVRDLAFRGDCGGQACYAYSSGKNHGM